MQQMTLYDFLKPCKKPATSATTAKTRRESHKKTKKTKMYEKVLTALGNEVLTAREIAIRLYDAGAIEYPARAVVQPRITELVENGTIEVVGKKYDSQTERNVAQYSRIESEV